jgi:hypothetical protein
MSLLKEFLRVDSDRRAALQRLRNEAFQRRAHIDELAQESKRKRDEISMLEEGLHRLADDIARIEQEILDLDSTAEENERDAHARKVDALRATMAKDHTDLSRVANDYRTLRAEFHAERERLLALADTGRMMDNYFQIETFLKDTGQPIPDAARKALLKERADLLAKIVPLVAPPPSPEDVLKGTVAYTALEGTEPKAVVALGFPPESTPSDLTDLAATLVYGAYASAVERLGAAAPRPRRQGNTLLFEMHPNGRSPEETALDLFVAVEEGMKKAAAAVSVRCELTGLFVEPEIGADVFVEETTQSVQQ